MNKNSALLLSALCFTLVACSDAEKGYSEVNDSEFIQPLVSMKKQNFDEFPFHDVPEWGADTAAYQGPYSESGEYFQEKNIVNPPALRNTVPIGQGDWLVAELYTRTEKPIVLDYIDIVADPKNANNQVLKISTPDHTDGVVLRSKNPLPPKYRISLKIGFAQYGNESKLNGYNDGNESAEPWQALSSVGHNGFYWLAILDSAPKPHNNIWIHHHRKFVIDSWNRKNFNNTVNVIALDGKSETHQAFGKKFISYVDGRWQKISDVPVDYYLPDEWYTVTFTRTALYYEYAIEGRFKNAGQTIYTDRIDYRKNCIYHYNQTAEELAPDCIDNSHQVFAGKSFTAWPNGSAYPEYFMFGEPHINYYEGSVLIDDISLEVL